MIIVIAKTATQVLLIVLALAVVAGAVLHFCFPQVMATFTEKVGNYHLATYYQSQVYNNTGDVADLTRCVDDAILSGDDKNIVQFGDALISHEKFDEVCDAKNREFANISLNFKQYVCGKVAISKYNLRDFNGAILLAKTANGITSFENNNALITLSLKIVQAKDTVCAIEMLSGLDGISPTSSTDVSRLNQIKQILTDLGD